jgi:hypothetical protein
MQRIVCAFVYVFVGGIIFWTPSVAMHASRGYKIRGLDMFILTLLLPLITLVGLAIFRKLRPERSDHAFIACSMLLGIWVLASLFILVGASFSTGKPLGAEGWKLVSIGMVLFPIFTFEISTYDGTLLAVLLITLVLILMSRRTLENL